MICICMMANRHWTLASLFLCLFIRLATLQTYKDSAITLKQVLEGNLQSHTYWLACQEHRSWTIIDKVTTVDNVKVETHPDWRHFEIVTCAQEDASCSGVDSMSYQSTCKTHVSYQPAMVRPVGSRDNYEIKLIALPGMCSCWIDDQHDQDIQLIS